MRRAKNKISKPTAATVEADGAEGASGADGKAAFSERGFILAQAALVFVPLLIFAAFATDIGSWYVEGQKIQRSVDAAALAGVAVLPDVDAAEQIARETAARNGFVDATPADNSDFETGPLPQVRVTVHSSEGIEVEIRAEATAYLGQVVIPSITIERYAVAEWVQPVHMGNPTSALGTGTISESTLGLPNDKMWLAVTSYCADHEQGDPFAVGYWDGVEGLNGYRGCGSATGYVQPGANVNTTFDDDAYIFVAEYQAGSPTIDLDVYEPGFWCGDTGRTGDGYWSPILNFEIYGPSATTNHQGFIDSNSPIATVSYDQSACISNAPGGDGWWPLLSSAATPESEGGYYYIKASTRNPWSWDSHPSRSFWFENGLNNFSLRVKRTGDTQLCAFSSADATCPQIYSLDWLPLFRQIPSNEAPFYLAEVDESHAGETMTIKFFDAAEGIDNLQFVDSNGTAMPFRWRYSDTSDGEKTSSAYFETAYVNHSDLCSWGGVGGQPCLDTSVRSEWNDHWVRVAIDIPDDYTCGADCWWQIRYSTTGSPSDRSVWGIRLDGDPVRLVE